MADVVDSRGVRPVSVVSGRTILITVGAVGLAALITTTIELMWGGAETVQRAEYAGVPAAAGLFTILIAILAFRLTDARERGRWLTVAASALFVCVGGAVWITSQPPQSVPGSFDSTPTSLYLMQYVLLLGVTISLLRDERVGRPFMKFAVWGIGVTVAAAIVLWLSLLSPALKGPQVAVLVRTAAMLVLAETVILGLPAVTLRGALSTSSDPRFTRAWKPFCAAIFVLIASDAGWFAMQAATGWRPGSLVDFGWMVTYGLMAVGASLALDGQQATVPVLHETHETTVHAAQGGASTLSGV